MDFIDVILEVLNPRMSRSKAIIARMDAEAKRLRALGTSESAVGPADTYDILAAITHEISEGSFHDL